MAERLPSASAPQRDIFVMLGHTTVVLLLLTLGYYLVPLHRPLSEPNGVLRASLTGVALVGLLWALRWQSRRSRTQPRVYLRIQWLLTALYLLVLGYALAYTILTNLDSSQFAGLGDRTDALYFSVTVMATVGFGDVHATETVSRLLVTSQMVLNLVYIGTALRLLSTLRDAPPAGGTG